MLERGFFINNRYEILSRVGAGGMSDVYKAKDHKLNRNVAIKVMFILPMLETADYIILEKIYNK